MPNQIVVITGGAGRIGTFLRERMRRTDRVLRLIDAREPADLRESEEAHVGSIRDRAFVRGVVEGADAVVHLAGIAVEAPWDQILATNVDGTQSVFEAAADAGVRTVAVASSNHAAGYWEPPADGSPLPDTVEPRPDSFYGWSKAAMESLGRLYHDRYGLTVVNLRIGWCVERPTTRRGAEIWLSPADAARLVEAAISPQVKGFHTVWGASANTTSWWSTAGGEAIGYHPEDDAERYAAELGPAEAPSGPLGMEFVEHPLGEPM